MKTIELDKLKVEPMTGSEIVKAGLLGGWEHLGIQDANEWVDEQRRKRRESGRGELS